MNDISAIQMLAINKCHTKEWANHLLEEVRKIKVARGANKTEALKNLELEIMGKLYAAEHDEAFAELLHSFEENLIGSLASLNETEKIFCTYLKLGLSKKNIALLMNIHPNSIQTIKSRIAEKLKLTNTQDLITHLNATK